MDCKGTMISHKKILARTISIVKNSPNYHFAKITHPLPYRFLTF